MRNVFVVLIVTLAASLALADGPTVAYKFVDRDGVVNFTDELKRVPEAYKASAEKIELGALADYERFTPRTTTVESQPVSERLSELRASNVVASNPTPSERDCGAVTVRSERRNMETNSGGSNARVFIVEDDCGVLFESLQQPELNALRR